MKAHWTMLPGAEGKGALTCEVQVNRVVFLKNTKLVSLDVTVTTYTML